MYRTHALDIYLVCDDSAITYRFFTMRKELNNVTDFMNEHLNSSEN